MSQDNTAEKQNVQFDLPELLKQIQAMREEGVSEETIRLAFEEAVREITKTKLPARSAMLRHENATPMPSQSDINKMYEERYKGIIEDANDPHVSLILDAMQRSKEVHALIQKPTLRQRARMLAYRAALSFVSAIVRSIVYVFGKLGVK